MDFQFEGMPEELRRHMTAVGDSAAQAVLTGKRQQALDLEKVEAETAVAAARVQVVTAEIELLEHDLARPIVDAERTHLQAKIALARTMLEKCQGEVLALQALYEIRQKLAEASLGLDPTLMQRMLGGMAALGQLEDPGDFDGNTPDDKPDNN